MTRRRRTERSPDRDSGPVVEAKREARKRFLDRRRAFPDAEAAAASLALCERLGDLPEFEAATRVVLYAAIPGSGELDLRPAFDQLRASGRCALYPRCLAGGRLEFVEVRELAALGPGRHGIPEPGGEAVPLCSEEDLVLVPGLAFDRDGVRLGLGGGYFDRTFAPGRGSSPRLVGVGYSWQLTDPLPREPHDRRMDAVLTDCETLRLTDLGPGEST